MPPKLARTGKTIGQKVSADSSNPYRVLELLQETELDPLSLDGESSDSGSFNGELSDSGSFNGDSYDSDQEQKIIATKSPESPESVGPVESPDSPNSSEPIELAKSSKHVDLVDPASPEINLVETFAPSNAVELADSPEPVPSVDRLQNSSRTNLIDSKEAVSYRSVINDLRLSLALLNPISFNPDHGRIFDRYIETVTVATIELNTKRKFFEEQLRKYSDLEYARSVEGAATGSNLIAMQKEISCSGKTCGEILRMFTLVSNAMDTPFSFIEKYLEEEMANSDDNMKKFERQFEQLKKEKLSRRIRQHRALNLIHIDQ